jgi:DNA-directed RNA polymerase subunit H (RpoH/RPB5)
MLVPQHHFLWKKEEEDNPAAKCINRAKLPTIGSQYLD